MSEAPPPPYICPDCGCVHLDDRDRIIEDQAEVIRLLEADLRSKRSQISKLKKVQASVPAAIRSQADELMAYWKRACYPAAKELGGKRRELCIERLMGGYAPDELMRAVYGYSLQPFVVNGHRTHEGPQDAWHADAALIFRDAKQVDQGIRIAERADDLETLFAQEAVEAVSGRSQAIRASDASLDLEKPRMLAAALQVAKTLALFPCRPREKTPATRNGFKDAKRDIDAIRKAWTLNPELNIAIPTGAINGLIVLDIDGDTGWDSYHALEDFHGDFPDTLSVKTPGGGHHFYFRHPGREIRNTTGFPKAGLDIRGDGGYVLIPPSVGAGGRRYEKDDEHAPAEMPAFLLELLVKRQAAEDSCLSGGMDWGDFINQGASQGDRDTRLTRYVGHMFHVGHPAKEVMVHAQVLNEARIKPPVTQKDLDRIVGSIARRHARH